MIEYFVLAAAVCLFVALVEAWLLVAVFSSETGPVNKIIPGRQDLLRSHIDYLMMSQFLFIFFLLMKALSLSPPAWVVVSACIGAFFNPFAFLVRAIKPAYQKHPPIAFMIMITVSCILTTAGFAATGWLVAMAVAR